MNNELRNLHSSSIIRTGCGQHKQHTWGTREMDTELVQKLETKRSFGTLRVYMKIILKWDLNKEDVKLIRLAEKRDQLWTILNIRKRQKDFEGIS
jgi:hypothetical protein